MSPRVAVCGRPRGGVPGAGPPPGPAARPGSHTYLQQYSGSAVRVTCTPEPRRDSAVFLSRIFRCSRGGVRRGVRAFVRVCVKCKKLVVETRGL